MSEREKRGERGEKREKGEKGMERREFLGAGAAAGYGVASPAWERFRRLSADGQDALRFFSVPQMAAVRVLADLIIPADDRSGSATDAGVPEFMDFTVSEAPDRTKQAWRDGLAWLDAECGRRYGTTFVACTDAERARVADDIAWPGKAPAALGPGVEFFTRARDLVAAGYFSSSMGVQALAYRGGVFVPDWQGCPPEALGKLGVTYQDWDRRYGGAR